MSRDETLNNHGFIYSLEKENYFQGIQKLFTLGKNSGVVV